MSIITMPSSPAFSQSTFGMKRAVAISESPFTGAQKVEDYDKAQWTATMTLPPMKREQARNWQAFFLKLQGRKNTFLMGDPDAKVANGNITSVSVSATANVRSTQVNLNLFKQYSVPTLEVGDYISFGTGTGTRLHMVVQERVNDGITDIEPPLKAQVTTSTPVDVTAAQGHFRMYSNEVNWNADHLGLYGITFSCSEVV
jgi:hypothetical protein